MRVSAHQSTRRACFDSCLTAFSFQQEGHDVPAEVREATAERLPTDGPMAALQDAVDPWDAKTGDKYGAEGHVDWGSAIRAGWGVRCWDVYEVLKRAGMTMSKVAVGQNMKRAGFVEHKTRTQGQVFVSLREPVTDMK